jgi:hypothetical protein
LTPPKSTLPIWLLLLSIILGVRIASGISLIKDFDQDPDAYRVLAENWSQHGTFGLRDATGQANPTAYRPPLYPWLLSWIVDQDDRLGRLPVLILHVMAGAVTCLLAGDIFRRLSNDHAWWPLVSILVAVDPILVRQASLVMTETIATLFAVVIWWVWIQPIGQRDTSSSLEKGPSLSVAHGVMVGLLMCLNVLCRPTGVVWCGLLVASVLLLDWKKPPIRRLSWALVIVVIMIAGLTPWALRNQRFLGQRVWLTTHGGYTLLLANNPLIYDHFAHKGPSRDWDAGEFHRRWSLRSKGDPATEAFWKADQSGVPPNILPVNRNEHFEIATDRIANSAAKATIRRQPVQFLTSCAIRTAWLWALWPAENNGGQTTRLAIGAWYAAIYFLAAAGIILNARRIFLLDRWLWMPGLLLAISLTLVHSVYWSNMRMRAPAMPLIYMLALYGAWYFWAGRTTAAQRSSSATSQAVT